MHKEIIIEDVAIYLRKSRGETEKDLDKHSDALIEICNDKGWKYETYKELVSGDTIEMRPIIQALLEDLEDDLYDAVMVIDQDRLSRGGTADSELIKETLVNSKTYLIESSKVFDLSTEQDEFVYDIKSFLARQEYKLIKKRLRRGKIQGAKKGLWTNGTPPLPYVYNKEEKILEVDEEKLVIYREIIDSVVKYKKPTNQIAYELNRKGMKTNGNRGSQLWSSKTVRDTLLDLTHLEHKDDKKKGHIVISKTKGNGHKKKPVKAPNCEKIDKSEWKKYKGLHKALKTKKEHDKIEVFLGRKTKAPRKTTAKQIYPLTELLRCSICGHFLGFTERSDRNGLLSVKKCWYVDPYGKKCSNRSAPMNPVIKEINKAIQKHIKDIEEEIEQIDLEKLNSISEKIQIMNKKITSKEEEINRHVEAFGAGAYTIDFYTKLLSRLNEEKKALSEDVRLLEIEYKYMQEQSSTERVNILKEFVDLIENPDLTWEDQNQLYKTIIDHVDYTRMNDDIMIAITYK